MLLPKKSADRVLEEPVEASFWRYCWRIWMLGWEMTLKVAGFLLLFFFMLLPAKALGAGVHALSQWTTGAPPAPWAAALAAVLFLFVYLPLAVYVAASWVGFCPRIASATDRQSD